MKKFVLAVAVLLVLGGCGLGGLATGSLTPKPESLKLRLATWNVYYGADLSAAVLAVAAGDPEAMVAAVSAAYAQLQATDFRSRAGVIADEIVGHGTDVVGLQEAALWRAQYPSDTFTAEPTPAGDVAFDFVAILIEELALRDATFEVAASIETFDAELPRVNADGELEDVRLTDREVILVRKATGPDAPGVVVHDADAGLYAARLVLPGGLEIPQGWVSIDARFRGRPFRFISTHLEADFQEIRLAQADELVSGPALGSGAIYVVGDMNSDALGAGAGGSPAYDLLTAGSLQDAALGFVQIAQAGTATRSADLDDPTDVLTERIDLILHNADDEFAIDEMVLLGAAPANYVGGLWPSDHAGAAVTLDLPTPRTP